MKFLRIILLGSLLFVSGGSQLLPTSEKLDVPYDQSQAVEIACFDWFDKIPLQIETSGTDRMAFAIVSNGGRQKYFHEMKSNRLLKNRFSLIGKKVRIALYYWDGTIAGNVKWRQLQAIGSGDLERCITNSNSGISFAPSVPATIKGSSTATGSIITVRIEE